MKKLPTHYAQKTRMSDAALRRCPCPQCAELLTLRKALKILATADPRAWTVELVIAGARDALGMKPLPGWETKTKKRGAK